MTSTSAAVTTRERMSWQELGSGARELAEQIVADGYRPDIILGIARGGLLVAGALSYALDVKNSCRCCCRRCPRSSTSTTPGF